MTSLIAATVEERSARGIARAIGRLISSGDLPAGSRLPTVRALAGELKMSPATVSEAWQSLVRTGAIETRGRSGTFVSDREAKRQHGRFWQLYPSGLGDDALDLSEGVPDRELLPPLTPVLARISELPLTTSYLDHPVLPELDELLRATWEFPVEALTVVNGALDALDRLVAALVGFGDRVVVEDPTFPPLLDLLELAGAEVIGVPMDADGMLPDAFAKALASDPAVVFVQPRAQNPTGISAGRARTAELARAAADAKAVIVEDDHSGLAAAAPLHSFGASLPERTVLIRSFSKSHGPDLRLAAIGGARQPIVELAARRRLGPSWTSRLLQRVLYELLTDGAAQRQVVAAGEEYAARRDRVCRILRDEGVNYTDGTGVNLWIEVADEQSALVNLAARGIGAAPGRPFLVDKGARDHMRVTTGVLRADYELVGKYLVEAANIGRRPGVLV